MNTVRISFDVTFWKPVVVNDEIIMNRPQRIIVGKFEKFVLAAMDAANTATSTTSHRTIVLISTSLKKLFTCPFQTSR